jgi:hypothetical protein
MNTKRGAQGTRSTTIALAVLLAAFGMNAHGWSVSGTVKSSTGTVLSGVAVTVKDSAKYSATTDASGNFSLVSPTAVLSSRAEISSSYSVQLAHGELQVRCPRDGSIGLSLVNSMGRSIWTADAVSAQGVARVAFPTKLAHGAIFLQIRHANGVENHSVVWGADGMHIAPSQSAATSASVTSAAAAAAYPVLQFKKTDYRDTSFSMTSETMTNVAVVMAAVSTQTCSLPTTLKWSSSGILVDIKPDGSHNMASVKDPTIQKYNGNYLIYCTIYNQTNSTWSMQFIKFSDFSQAAAVTPFFMDQVSGFSGYKCAPELFYFEPKNLWYLTWQQQDPAYSTTTTPDVPSSWSAPKSFFSGAMPGGISLPIDYFPIADATNFYIFFTGDDGKVYRIKTTVANFPSGFGSPVVAKSLNGTDIIFEGSSHYKIKGTTNTYLHLVEGQGSTGRVYSAWTSEGLEGTWQDYKVGSSTPFAGKNNVTFSGSAWTNDISHGELLRDNPNQTQELDLCNLKLLYQGRSPSSSGKYELLPYKIGLLTAQ